MTALKLGVSDIMHTHFIIMNEILVVTILEFVQNKTSVNEYIGIPRVEI